MNSLHTLAVGAAAGIAMSFGAGCVTLSDVPDALVPAGEAADGTLAAHGVQVYECRAGTGGATPAWAFVAPRAELFDAGGRRFGSHGAGPSWQATDGSRIVGRVLARSDAPRADAVAWLLLATEPDPGAAAGRLTRVTHVQRVATQGGVAPAQGCDAARIGSRAEVAYSAEYRLFTRTPPARAALATEVSHGYR